MNPRTPRSVSSSARAAALLAAAIAALPAAAYAQSTWDRGAATNNWGDANNWDPDGVPADGANVTFGATGAGTVSLGGNRTVGNFTVSGTLGSAYTFNGTAGNQLSWSGLLTNSSNQNLTLNQNLALVGTGSMLVQGTRIIALGEFGSLGDRNNTFSGGVVLVGQNNLNVQYSSIGTGSAVKDIVGTGNLQFGDGTLNGTGGRLGFNQAGSANATYKNNFVNNVQRDNNGFNGTLAIAHQGGIGAEVATYSRFTGSFTTTALTGGATTHGWTNVNGREVTDSSRQFSAATFEFSGDWTGYNPTNSRLTFAHGAFLINSTSSVGGSTYNVNSNNNGAQSTVLALGVDGITFNRNVDIQNTASGGSNLASAKNQTYIGGRQSGTSTYSGALTLVRAGAHRLNLFSQSGTTQFSGGLTTNADQVVAINSGYSMTVYGALAATGETTGNSLTAFNPTGTVAFTAGTKTFNGAVEVKAGTLLVNQTIGGTGALTVDSGAFLGGSGTINNATTVNGTLAPGNSPGVLTFNSTLTLAGNAAFELNSATRSTGYDGVNTGAGLLTYGGTLGVTFGSAFLTENTTFDLFQIGAGGQTGSFSSVASSSIYTFTLNSGNSFSSTDQLGNLWSFSHTTGDLTFTAVPEPSAFAALAGFGALGFVAMRRRRR